MLIRGLGNVFLKRWSYELTPEWQVVFWNLFCLIIKIIIFDSCIGFRFCVAFSIKGQCIQCAGNSQYHRHGKEGTEKANDIFPNNLAIVVLNSDFQIAWLPYSALFSWQNWLCFPSSFSILYICFENSRLLTWAERSRKQLVLRLGIWFICCRSSTFCPRLSLPGGHVCFSPMGVNKRACWKNNSSVSFQLKLDVCINVTSWCKPRFLARAAQVQGPLLRLLTLPARGPRGDC